MEAKNHDVSLEEVPEAGWDWAKPRLLARLERLKSLVRERPPCKKAVREELHRLAGTFGCFGFTDCSRLARSLEESVLKGEDPSGFTVQLDRLQSGIGERATQGPGRILAEVAIFSRDDFPLLDFVALGYSRDIAIRPVDGLEDLIGRNWDTIILDSEHSCVSHFPTDLGVRLLTLVRPADLESNLRAVELGSETTCPRGEHPRVIFGVLCQMLESSDLQTRRLLVLDEDGSSESSLRLLPPQECLIERARTASELWKKLGIFMPDVILLEQNSRGPGTPKLCRAIRAEYRWRDLPIIALSGSSAREALLELYEAGADDVLTKPLDEELLLSCLAGHWRRRRAQETGFCDELTALPTRKLASRELGRMLSLVRRQRSSMAICVLDLDHFKQVNDVHGHAMGDQVLARLGQLLKTNFRTEDVVSRWGGEEFLIGMINCDGVQATIRMERLLDSFSKFEFASAAGTFRPTFSAGVATFPATGDDLRILYRQADAALYQAKSQGRAQVVLKDGFTDDDAVERVDIALLEDDEELASLLIRAFEARGFSCLHFRDGLRALEAWVEAEILPPKVLVIDNALPGLTGVEFLKRIVGRDLLKDSKVITLSAVMEDSEILETVTLGAWEHIPKPFRLNEMVRKVERLLTFPGRVD